MIVRTVIYEIIDFLDCLWLVASDDLSKLCLESTRI